MSSLFRPLNLATVILCFGLVVLGAYVRLSNAGLGCPDWPGCYGHVGVPDEAHELAAAAANYARPVEAHKAWKEMVHRYLAGIVGLLIAVLAVIAWRDPARRLPRALAAAIAGVVLVQIVFGALTVTLKVNPLIVTTHLLLGLTTLALLAWMWLRAGEAGATGLPAEAARSGREPRSERAFALQSQTAELPPSAPRISTPAGLRWLAPLALVVLVLQLFLGGWVSTNYAALACPDFPTCHGSLLPKTSLSRAFTLWHGHDIDYEYGILDVAARATVHLVHRYGAALVAIVLGALSGCLLRARERSWQRLGAALLGAVILQIAIGIGLVHLQLPLWLADAHNAGAALLLLVVVTVNHFALRPPRAAP